MLNEEDTEATTSDRANNGTKSDITSVSNNIIPHSSQNSNPSQKNNSGSGIYDDPNARHSKDDTIYDFYDDGDFGFGEEIEDEGSVYEPGAFFLRITLRRSKMSFALAACRALRPVVRLSSLINSFLEVPFIHKCFLFTARQTASNRHVNLIC